MVQESDPRCRPVIIFDFDGTLEDTEGHIVTAATQALSETGFTPEQMGGVSRVVGPPYPGAFAAIRRKGRAQPLGHGGVRRGRRSMRHDRRSLLRHSAPAPRARQASASPLAHTSAPSSKRPAQTPWLTPSMSCARPCWHKPWVARRCGASLIKQAFMPTRYKNAPWTRLVPGRAC